MNSFQYSSMIWCFFAVFMFTIPPFLSCKLHTSFSTFSIFILQVKIVYHFEAFRILNIDFKKYPFSLSSLYWDLFLTYLKHVYMYIHVRTFVTFPIHANYLRPIIKIRLFFIFIIICHAFVISLYISANSMIYIIPDGIFYH